MARRWIFVPLLAAAVAGPPLFMNEDGEKKTNDIQSASFQNQSWLGQATGEQYQVNPEDVASPIPGLDQNEAAMLDPNRITYAPGAVDFREAFRFDANPQWLHTNWPHVSTSQSLDGFTGYRVPLVTGPNPQDITGALTYYFGRKGLCERITFYGYTSDPTRIVQLATETFGLEADRDLGTGIYTREYARSARSYLGIEYGSSFATKSSQKKLQVTFEVNNPKGKFTLSPEVSRIISGRQQTRQASFRR